MTKEVSRFPGYRSAVTPSTYYEAPEGPWVWITYSDPDEDGLCVRRLGFAESREEAKAAVR